MSGVTRTWNAGDSKYDYTTVEKPIISGTIYTKALMGS